MTAIAANPSNPAVTTLLAGIATGSSGSADAKPKDSPAGQPTDSVELSDRAKAILAKAAADKAATADLTLSFDEILQKRSDALASKLTDAFKGLNVNLDDAVRLQVDKFGNVTTEGPWKKKIEKLFADDPELAKEFKAVAGLSALKAANTALELYNKDKGASAGSKQQQQAWTQYNIRSINIQTLSGVLSLKDGNLRSAAVDYIDTIADPHGDGTIASQKNIADRLA
ncbi:MAG: hypothetical protein HXX15_21750 [Rhodopseudomonas sp.]|uniref:hypothetical protein n=1 Tax=Rhodopseudomonas sp. TaxID=1078 RepID=UPI00182B20EE|nr:hypothetical protein [Rhodopseudomonas sp.]NVN88711.1 hypothetical protein [Rhodopseudomonas sp.]